MNEMEYNKKKLLLTFKLATLEYFSTPICPPLPSEDPLFPHNRLR